MGVLKASLIEHELDFLLLFLICCSSALFRCSLSSNGLILYRVIKGTALLTPEVQQAALALLRRETPVAWLKLWDGSDDPLVWLRLVASKTLALCSWLALSQADKLLRKPLDLAELFRPDVFLNALRQQAAEHAKCPIDGLKFACSWATGHLPNTALICRLTGLYLQGCLFDAVRLTPADRTSSSVCEVPECLVTWVPLATPDVYGDNALSVPLYDSEEREKVVARLTLPCSQSDCETWIKAGAALFLKAK